MPRRARRRAAAATPGPARVQGAGAEDASCGGGRSQARSQRTPAGPRPDEEGPRGGRTRWRRGTPTARRQGESDEPEGDELLLGGIGEQGGEERGGEHCERHEKKRHERIDGPPRAGRAATGVTLRGGDAEKRCDRMVERRVNHDVSAQHRRDRPVTRAPSSLPGPPRNGALHRDGAGQPAWRRPPRR
jgi:hypothetical protein